MNKTIKIIFIITILQLLNNGFIYPAKYTGERMWMLTPISARAAAMGNGFIALLDGANTVFWNPGGTAFLNGLNISRSNSPNILIQSGEEYETYNFAFNTNFKKSFLFGLNLQSYNNIKYYYYDDIYYIPSNRYYQDSIIGFLFGYRKGNTGIGINTKFFLSTLKKYIVKNFPVALDIGVLDSRDFVLKNKYSLNIKTGLSILNISKDIKYESVGGLEYRNRLPFIIRAGYSLIIKPLQKTGLWTPIYITHNLEYSFIMNADRRYDKFADYQSLGLGLEVATYEFLFSRIGYHFKESPKKNRLYTGITYGVGLKIPVYYFFKSLPITVNYDYGTFPYDIQSMYKELNYTTIHSFNITYIF